MVMGENKCVFCSIASKVIDSNVIYEDEKIISFLDIDPINEGHILIIPKQHYHDIDELDEDNAYHIFKFSIKTTKVLKKIYKPDGYGIMQNGGIFTDFGHFHLHVFPRYKSDGFGWTCSEIEKSSSEEIRNRIVSEIEGSGI